MAHLKHLFFRPALVAVLCCCIVPQTLFSETADTLPEPDRLAEDFVLTSLCVADPTDWRDDVMGVVGHAFLRLQCPYYGLDYCFSYEGESVNENIFRALLHQTKMSMFAVPTNKYIEDYNNWHRAVHEYRINLPPEAEIRLWEQMDNHMIAEHNMSADLIKFGCTSTLIRFVETALQPDTIAYFWPEKYRTSSVIEIVKEYYTANPWIFLIMRMEYGKSTSHLQTPKQKVIIPMELVEVWSLATLNGHPLLTYVGDLVEAEPVVVSKPWFTPKVCGIMLVLIVLAVVVAVVIIRKRRK